jgi:hypothetical protein
VKLTFTRNDKVQEIVFCVMSARWMDQIAAAVRHLESTLDQEMAQEGEEGLTIGGADDGATEDMSNLPH